MPMATSQRYWTLEDLHAFPEDGTKREVIHGELFVSPIPAPRHEKILARLNRILLPYVEREKLGDVLHRGGVRTADSEVEPDLMVLHLDPNLEWEAMPLASLVVEVHSPDSRGYDGGKKRNFYIEHGIPEYWMIDGKRRTITVVRPGTVDRVVSETMTWHPAGATTSLEFRVEALF